MRKTSLSRHDALGTNPFVITAAQLLANFTDVDDDAIADLSVVNLMPTTAPSLRRRQRLGSYRMRRFRRQRQSTTSRHRRRGLYSSLTAKLAVTNVNDDLMTIGAGLIPTSPVAQKTKRLRSLASKLLDSIDYDENWDEEDLRPTSPSPLLVLVRLSLTERVVSPSILPKTSTALFPSPTRLLIQKTVPLMRPHHPCARR